MDVLETLRNFENVPITQMAPWLAAVAVLLFGVILGRLGVRSAGQRVLHLEDRIEQLKTRATDRGRMKNAAREEVANLALSLAPVVHDLNRDDLSREDAPKLVMRMARGLFDPKQILLYAVRNVHGQYGVERELHLVTYQGLSSVPKELKTIRMGEGKIGWVAQHELERTRDDWTKAAANGEAGIADNHRSLLPDLIGPLVHYSKEGQHLLGVLCIGMPGKRPPEPKLTLRMVTDFGSLALVMASHLSQLRNQAHHDGLTKLYNKRRFLGELGPEMLIECDRKGQQFTIFIFDIDNFKHYNDRNGHPAGDKLLREMGDLIRDSLTTGLVACRYGGEEFVVALPNTDTDAAFAYAEGLRIRISETEFDHREAQPLGCVSISGGIATSPRDAGSVEELLKLADKALYRGKKGGRNAVNRHETLQIGDETGSETVSGDAVELADLTPDVDPAATDPSLIGLGDSMSLDTGGGRSFDAFDPTTGALSLEAYMEPLAERLGRNGVVGMLSITLLDRERGCERDAWSEYHDCRVAVEAYFREGCPSSLRESDEMLPPLVNGNSLLVLLGPARDGRAITVGDLPAVRQRVRYALSAHLSSTLAPAAFEAFGVYIGAALMRHDAEIPCPRIVYRCVEEAFADATRQRAGECASSAADLQRLLRSGSIGTVFQPLVDLERRDVFAFEALTRVSSGPYPRPDLLFGAAAKHGMLWELERICREQALDGAAALNSDTLLFLNIERESMHDPALFGAFVDRIREVGLVPERVVLELTEHSSIRDFEGFRSVRDDCRRLGIRLALDDVGSGFSSLQAIAEIEPDFLKVDMSLVRDVHLRAIKRELIATIQQFSEKTGSTMIAEGVECHEELGALHKLGVRCAQGYLFAKPASPPPAPDWDLIPTTA